MTDNTTPHKAETALPRHHSWQCMEAWMLPCRCGVEPRTRPGPPESPALSCSALWSRNQAVSCHVTFPHTVHRGSSEPDAPSWGDGECVPGTLTAGRGGR